MEGVLGKQRRNQTTGVTMWAQIINMVLGLAVMVLPGWLGFEKAASNNNYIVGPLVITFALVAITDAGRNVRLFNIPAGFWLMVGPLVLGFSNTARLTDMLLSIFIILLSLVRGTVAQGFGGGWRSLLQKNPEHWQAAKRIIETQKKGS